MCLMKFNIRVTKSFAEFSKVLGTLVGITGVNYINEYYVSRHCNKCNFVLLLSSL